MITKFMITKFSRRLLLTALVGVHGCGGSDDATPATEGLPADESTAPALSVAFPDYHLELRQAFGEGEWLALRLHATGTMTGSLLLRHWSALPLLLRG